MMSQAHSAQHAQDGPGERCGNPARRLRRLHLTALGSIALLTIAGQALIQATLRDQMRDAERVSLSGRDLRDSMQHLSRLELALTVLIMAVLAAQGALVFAPAVRRTRRQFDELLRAREAADAALRSKDELLASMSHEIRTPMTAVLGYTELLVEDPESARRREYLGIIGRSGRHLLGVLDQVLDLARLDADRMTVARETVRPARVVDEVASLMRVRALDKGLELSVEHLIPPDLAILTDQTRLRQIVVNLIANAVKFTERGGVRVVTSPEEGGERQRPTLRIEVSDTGIGMSADQLARIFEPFRQEENRYQRASGGTGLGLAISKGLAALLGGDITVASRPGEGTTFTLVLDAPRAPALDEPSDAAQRAPARLRGRILLAEDGPDNQRLISFLLTRAGARVDVVEDGGAAVEAARGGGFDLILMDMQMPRMDGYEAVRRLREAGFAGPIVALTAHAMAGDRERCARAGCDDYLSKPVDRGALIASCAEWMEKGRAGGSARAA